METVMAEENPQIVKVLLVDDEVNITRSLRTESFTDPTTTM